MSDEFDDDYNEFMERIKKFLNIDADRFDFDIIFLPESEMHKEFDPYDENLKGIKVHYYFEKGMEKPEIRIEGDFDNKKLREYFKNLNIKNLPQLKPLVDKNRRRVLESKSITLNPPEDEFPMETRDQYLELNLNNEGGEIVLEAPGIEKGHVILSLNEDGKQLKIIIQSKFKDFEKIIDLPFKATLEDHIIEVNNGILTIQIKNK